MDRGFKGVWIPCEIWVSKDLTIQEKFFLAEVDSLDTEEGCFASNKYFADFFDLSERRISQIIKELKNKDYIKVSFQMEGRQIIKRFIKINKAKWINVNDPLKEITIGGEENYDTPRRIFQEGGEENCVDNNIDYNIVDNININNKKENREKKKFGEFGNVLLTEEEHNKLIDRYGTQTLERFIKNLDLWLGEGHTKKSHYMTIIRWVENEKEKGVKSYAGNTGAYRARNETGYHGFTPSTGVKTEPDF